MASSNQFPRDKECGTIAHFAFERYLQKAYEECLSRKDRLLSKFIFDIELCIEESLAAHHHGR